MAGEFSGHLAHLGTHRWAEDGGITPRNCLEVEGSGTPQHRTEPSKDEHPPRRRPQETLGAAHLFAHPIQSIPISIREGDPNV